MFFHISLWRRCVCLCACDTFSTHTVTLPSPLLLSFRFSLFLQPRSWTEFDPHVAKSGPSIDWKLQPKTRLEGFPHLAAHVWKTLFTANAFAVAVVWNDQTPVGRIKDAVTETILLRGHSALLCCLETPLASDSGGRNTVASLYWKH